MFVRRHAEPDFDVPLAVRLGGGLVVYCIGKLDNLPVVCSVAQSLVRRLAVGLDLEVRDQPRGVAHKPWNELVVHVNLCRKHFLSVRDLDVPHIALPPPGLLARCRQRSRWNQQVR